MSEEAGLRSRQWVALPGGSCDVRLGTGVIDEAAAVLKGSVGKPRASALVVESGIEESLVERLRRQLTDAGFSVERLDVPAGDQARRIEAAADLLGGMSYLQLTSDDLMVAVGGADVLSLASYACAQWCGGMPLVTVPTGQTALLEAVVTPRGLDVGSRERAIQLRPSTKHALFDLDAVEPYASQEDELMARVIMVVTAMCDSEKAFSRLWDRTEDLCAGNREVLVEQAQDTLKLRGKIVASTALATRQSITYGEAFAAALRRLVPEIAPSTARAEALRFQARLSAGEGHFEVDDVLAQDELLDRLGLPLVEAVVDADELVAAVRSERFARTNRFLLGLPRALGRVRLAAVSDDLIAEHVAAWCASRA